MNYKMVGRYLSLLVLLEAVFMIPALAISAFSGDKSSAIAFIICIVEALLLGGIGALLTRNASHEFYEKEGFVIVGLGWIVLSLVGAQPFVISGQIPHYIDAFFEVVSGFTTTGASILTNVEGLTRGMLYWRSFTHWIGGMGMLVFLLAVVPGSKGAGFTMHVLRAESPGPNVGKIAPRMRQTAMYLYIIYLALTVACFLFLIAGRMPIFDAVCTSFGTAGTGGFGVKNDSMAGYSTYLQNVVTVFMILFGINFSCYYLVLIGRIKSVLKDGELRLYLGIILVSIIAITINVRHMFPSIGVTVQQVAFQVATIISTTGFATADFDLWPTFSKAILVMLMICGASAGSTGGGFKVGRFLLAVKSVRLKLNELISPQKVLVVRNNGQVVGKKVIDTLNTYILAYVLIVLISFIVVCADNFEGQSLTTSMTAVLACFNNIGPGLEAVGPTSNYAAFSYFSKIILAFDMLAGRLEIFPILVLLSRSTWKKLS